MYVTDSTPLWLKVALGVVPLVAALLGGLFLIANTAGRRIERLKNMVDIYKACPGVLNPDYTLELLILRELSQVDFVTSPRMVKLKRDLIRGLVFLALAYTLVMGVTLKHRYDVVSLIGTTIVAAYSLLYLGITFVQAKRCRDRYQQKYDSFEDALNDLFDANTNVHTDVNKAAEPVVCKGDLPNDAK